MKKEYCIDESWLPGMASLVFSLVFASVNMASIIGPGFVAFVIGFGKKNGMEEFSVIHLLISTTVGGVLFIITIMFFLWINFISSNSLNLSLLVANFFINFLSSLALFSLGDYISRVKEARRLAKFYGFI